MKPYAARRANVLAQMHAMGGAAAIIATAPEQVRNNDCDFPFRHDSNFYYLSGFEEPSSVIVLIASPNGKTESLLFCREKNPEREIWDGFRHGPQAAQEQYGFDAAYPICELDHQITTRLATLPALYYALGGPQDARVTGWLHTMRQNSRSAPHTCHNLANLLDEMRLFKDESELATLRRAGQISANAHIRAMRSTRPNMHEYEIEAELLYEFRRNGAQSPAYTAIVASGANACVLHYSANNALCKEGDLLLIDAGCELNGYAADITRTFPVNGRFTGPQKDCYEVVLAAQQAALDQAMPGRPYNAMHDAAVRVLTQGMLDLGLLNSAKVGSLDDAIEKKAFRQFYMHGTGHWLGMDVHDVGDYRTGTAPEGGERAHRLLQPGMVLTVEPGLYVRPAENVPEAFWHIGVRIEDDVFITPTGHENLSQAAPRSVAEIEAIMQA
jgi:Xaa-Pro aminopeptidase